VDAQQPFLSAARGHGTRTPIPHVFLGGSFIIPCRIPLQISLQSGCGGSLRGPFLYYAAAPPTPAVTKVGADASRPAGAGAGSMQGIL